MPVRRALLQRVRGSRGQTYSGSSMTQFSNLVWLVVLLCAAVHAQAVSKPQPCSSYAACVRRFLQQGEKWDKKKDNRATQASAYTSSQGQEPGGAGDAFTYLFSESSSTSNYDGVYYNDDGKTVRAGDMAKGGWAGAYSKNSPDKLKNGGTTAAIASNFDTEMSSQRGPQAISGTYEGARAVAGSSSFFNAAKKDSLGGSAMSYIIDTYGPTTGDAVSVRKGDGPDKRRSVAFTNIAPNSAAQSGTGNGPAAISTGWEVAAAARAARDRKPTPVTIGHRDKGENGIWDRTHGRRHRRLLLLLQRPANIG